MQHNPSSGTAKSAVLPVIGVLLMVAVFAPDFVGGQFQFNDFIPFLLSSAGLAWLFTVGGTAIGLLSTVAAYLVSLLTTASPLYALGALMILPFALAFSFVMKQKLSRTAAVTISATGTVLFLAVSLLLPVVLSEGSLSIQAIKTYHSSFIDTLHLALKDSFTVHVAGKDVPFFTPQNAEGYVNLILGLLPGIFTLYALLVGLIGGSLFRLFLRFSHHSLPGDSLWRIRPAGVTGIYVLLVLLLTAFLPSDTLVWLTTANLCLMFLPFFFMAGAASVFEARMVNGMIRPRFLRGFVLFFSIFFGIFGPILVSIVFGLYDSILSLFPKRKNRQQS